MLRNRFPFFVVLNLWFAVSRLRDGRLDQLFFLLRRQRVFVSCCREVGDVLKIRQVANLDQGRFKQHT